MNPQPVLAPAAPDARQPLRLSGPLTVHDLERVQAIAIPAAGLDISGLTQLDTAGAWQLLRWQQAGAPLQGASARHAALLRSVAQALGPTPVVAAPAAARDWRAALAAVGRHVATAARYNVELAGFLGRFIVGLGRSLLHPSQFRLTAFVHHCQESGLKAVPIVALICALIAVVIAFQGATLLTQFGAEIFVVDLIAISILRELGVLLTAIIVAGRTASGLTASIGSMKMREEIDAMRTLGLDPDMVLLVPRVLALIVMLPLLTLIANLSGLLGGALMTWITLDISPPLFEARMIQNTGLTHAAVGLSKAPVFALIIGIIGCHAGMSVGNDAEALGRMTSHAVVRAIFAVIVVDALFSVFFAQVGI